MTELLNDGFKWPDSPYPPASWWMLRGTELKLETDQIKFAAALVMLGGIDSKNNSMAATLAGMELSRTQAFRLARSVKVKKLVTEAEETKSGQRKPLTEDQIDQRIDKMIASPNDMAAAKGIELRDRRRTAVNATRAEESLEENLAAIIAAVPESGAGAFVALSAFRTNTGNLINFPFLAEVAPVVARYYPGEWQNWRIKEKEQWVTDFLDKMAAGPFLEGDQLSVAVKHKLPD